MAEQLREVAAIAADPHPATFENTIVALERSGQLLTRVRLTFSNLNDCNSDPQMEKIDAEMSPRLAAHRDAIHLNAALWARIDQLYHERASLNLDSDSAQLLLRYHAIFVRAGARLRPPQQVRLRELNKRIASLTTRFRQNVLKATQDGAVRSTPWPSSTDCRASRSAQPPPPRPRAGCRAGGSSRCRTRRISRC